MSQYATVRGDCENHVERTSNFAEFPNGAPFACLEMTAEQLPDEIFK